jgi:stage II sporulation protein GA (sporulation sigma-E factor processing peptidase)
VRGAALGLTVYVDVLFLVNFCIDSIILYTTAKISKKQLKLWKLATSGAISALYSCLTFFCEGNILHSIFAKAIFSAFIIFLSFGTLSFREFFRTLAIFYLISVAFAGSMFCGICFTSAGKKLGFIMSNGVTYLNIDIFSALFYLSLAYVLIRLFSYFCILKFSKKNMLTRIEVILNNKNCEFIALTDTGNSLIEPISHMPVIVAEFSQIKDILPPELSNYYENFCGKNINFLKIYENFGEKINLRLIPFSGIGIHGGLILGFIPDKIKIMIHDKIYEKKAVIAIYNANFQNDNEYQAIIAPNLVA